MELADVLDEQIDLLEKKDKKVIAEMENWDKQNPNLSIQERMESPGKKRLALKRYAIRCVKAVLRAEKDKLYGFDYFENSSLSLQDI